MSHSDSTVKKDKDDDECIRVKTVKSSKSRNGEEDVQEENGVLFWVNKSGFPIDNKTWERMWDHVAKIHPDSFDMVRKVRNSGDLPQVPFQAPPINFPSSTPVSERIEKVQNYMRNLQYNHTGTQFYEVRKNRPISGLMDLAREMIKESLPIKCLEAIILGIFLTNGMLGVERFPISFKSVFNGNVHRHVVLGIYYSGRWGTIGMSRREELMYKPLVFKSLADLMFDYEKSYNLFYHEVKKMKIGLPAPHDPHSYEFINWKTLTLTPGKQNKKEMTKDLEHMAKEIRLKARLNVICQTEMFFPSMKAKSYSTHQCQSPRKTYSTAEFPYHESNTQRSIREATKVYRSQTSINAESLKKFTSTNESADYQLRI
ncbi:VASH [Mytilus edulis]|uniref:VASH n=1 Tax=Mytilus edulis TaxID=6550 RepID=A0A8S3T1P3_MYTED|nr:VASH [Mytilus edulis]